MPHHLKRLPIRRHLDHRPIVLAPGRPLLPALRDKKSPIPPQLHRIRKLPSLRRLRKEIAEHLIPIALPIPIRIHQLPNPTPIIHKRCPILHHHTHRLMQPRSKPPPSHLLQIPLQPRNHPHIPIKRHPHRIPLRIQKIHIRQPHIALPSIRHRQCYLVHHIRFLRS